MKNVMLEGKPVGEVNWVIGHCCVGGWGDFRSKEVVG